MNDFDHYVLFYRRCRPLVCVRNEPVPVLDRNRPAREAFARWDSRGGPVPGARHPRLLRAAILGKRALNLHLTDIWGPSIRCWSRDFGRAGAAVFLADLLEEVGPLPKWAVKILARQVG